MGSANISDPVVRHMVAQNIRHYLATNEWSESELARRSGVSQKQVNNITRERYGCTAEALFALARAFRVPAYQLLIPGRAESDATPDGLDAVVVAYLRGTDALRDKLRSVAR